MHPNQWLRAVPPDESGWAAAPGVHADCFELQGSLRQITVWSPIFHVTPETGALPLFRWTPGSIPVQLTLSSENMSGWTLTTEGLEPCSQQESILSPSDAVVFYSTTPHGGSRNRGEGWRVSVETRYQPVNDFMERSALEPYDGSSWSDPEWTWKRRSIERLLGQNINLVDFDPVFEDWRAIEALRLGQIGDESAFRALENATLHRNPLIARQAQELIEWNGWR